MPSGGGGGGGGRTKLAKLVIDILKDIRTRIRHGRTGRTGPHAVGGARNPLHQVPRWARRRPLRPDPHGGAQYGVEYIWRRSDGQRMRMRVHGPDGTAPAGSNSASGVTYRTQVGGRYQDAAGNLHPRNVHNPNSPHYNPGAANATHIPWPSGVPYPWGDNP